MCCDFSAAPSEAPAGFEGKALSATEAFVWWLPLLQDSIDGYQVSGSPQSQSTAVVFFFNKQISMIVHFR